MIGSYRNVDGKESIKIKNGRKRQGGTTITLPRRIATVATICHPDVLLKQWWFTNFDTWEIEM